MSTAGGVVVVAPAWRDATWGSPRGPHRGAVDQCRMGVGSAHRSSSPPKWGAGRAGGAHDDGTVARVRSPVMVGRDIELRRLRDAAGLASAGEPMTALVVGEAGIG